MRRRHTGTLLGLALFWAVGGNAGTPVFRDWAEVVAVEPQTERHYRRVVQRQCDDHEVNSFASLPPAETLAADIRLQQRLWTNCREVQSYRPEERISGYRVTYRYGGHTRVRLLDYDPGERLPIEVTLSTAD